MMASSFGGKLKSVALFPKIQSTKLAGTPATGLKVQQKKESDANEKKPEKQQRHAHQIREL